MFYLLPTEQKKSLLSQYKMRLTFVSVIISSALVVIAFALLIPSFLSVSSKENEILSDKKLVEELLVKKSGNDLEKTISDLKKNISILASEDPKVSASILIVESAISNGIHIKKFAYSYAKDSKSVLTLSGTADSRPGLLLFSNNLQTHPEFKKVDLPISNLAKNSNIDFNINITGAF